MKIKFTCPKCGCHDLVHKVSFQVQKDNVVVGLDKDCSPIYAQEPAKEGYWESNEIDDYECGNSHCQTPICDTGHPSVDEVIDIGLAEGWIEKVEE